MDDGGDGVLLEDAVDEARHRPDRLDEGAPFTAAAVAVDEIVEDDGAEAGGGD